MFTDNIHLKSRTLPSGKCNEQMYVFLVIRSTVKSPPRPHIKAHRLALFGNVLGFGKWIHVTFGFGFFLKSDLQTPHAQFSAS